MIPAQRRELLVRELRGTGVLSVKELCEILDVSHMTVRRDIMTLEEEGRVRSVPGGVELVSQVRSEPSYRDKSRVDVAEKRAMARAAAAMVGEGQTVYLDAGTTLASPEFVVRMAREEAATDAPPPPPQSPAGEAQADVSVDDAVDRQIAEDRRESAEDNLLTGE